MPHKAPHPCPNCSRLTRRPGRCARCRTDSERHRTRARPWYASAEYRRNAKIVRRNAGVCHLCGRPFKPGEKVTVDHVIPARHYVDRGLPVDNSLDNLRPAHSWCNTSKGSRR